MKRIKFTMILVMIFALLFAGCSGNSNGAGGGKNVVVLEDTVFIGDRILDIANTVGVMPKYAAARYSQWPKSKSFKTQKLGCPNRVLRKQKQTIPNLIDNEGVKKIVIEDTGQYCLFVKDISLSEIYEIVKGKDVEITVFDFKDGNKKGIIELSKYLGKEKEGIALADKYEKEMAEAEASMKTVKKGKKVVVFKCFLDKEDNLIVLAESPDFYTDRIFLNDFGAVNVSLKLNTKNDDYSHGFFQVSDLTPLTKANPDIIILHGPDKGKKRIKEEFKKLAKSNEEFAKIPAIKNKAIADSLPLYIGNDVADGPRMIKRWVKFFKSIE